LVLTAAVEVSDVMSALKLRDVLFMINEDEEVEGIQE